MGTECTPHAPREETGGVGRISQSVPPARDRLTRSQRRRRLREPRHRRRWLRVKRGDQVESEASGLIRPECFWSLGRFQNTFSPIGEENYDVF